MPTFFAFPTPAKSSGKKMRETEIFHFKNLIYTDLVAHEFQSICHKMDSKM